jgi:protein-glutamine gamma-glutamyltransferase
MDLNTLLANRLALTMALLSALGFGTAASVALGAIAGFGIGLVCGLATLAALVVKPLSRQSGKRESDLLAVAGLGSAVVLFVTQGLQTALLGLLVFAFLALCRQSQTVQRFYWGLAITFIALVTACVAAQTGALLFGLALFSLAAVSLLGQLHRAPDDLRKTEPHRETDAQAADASAQDAAAAQEAVTVQWLWREVKPALQVLALGAVIYLVMPRFPAGDLGAGIATSDTVYSDNQWEQQAQSHVEEPSADAATEPPPDSPPPNGLYHGLASRFNIQDAQSSRRLGLIARVRADQPLYLKTRLYDEFDGVHWTQSPGSLAKIRLERGQLQLAQPQSLPPGFQEQTGSYQVSLVSPISNSIPLADSPVQLHFPATVLAQDRQGLWYAPRTLAAGTVYSARFSQLTWHSRHFTGVRPHITGVQAASDESARLLTETEDKARAERLAALSHYLQLPADLDSRIPALATAEVLATKTQKRWAHLSQEAPELATALILETFLRDNYTYDPASVFNSQGQTPLAPFLFDSRLGHCEYFASALAILLRTQGIPARLATGFLAQKRNPFTGFYEIHSLDGHAWVEAYVDDRGWVQLEPTPSFAPQTEGATGLSTGVSQLRDYLAQWRQEADWNPSAMPWWQAWLDIPWALAWLLSSALGALGAVLIKGIWLWLPVCLLALAYGVFGSRYTGQVLNRWMAYRLKHHNSISVAQGMAFIKLARERQGKPLAAGLTIESLLDHLKSRQLTPSQQLTLTSLFNRYRYADNPLNHNELETLQHLVLILLREQLRG